MQEVLILAILFFAPLLLAFGLLQNFCVRRDFPYTVIMLLAGLVGQFFFKNYGNGHFEPHLPPEIVFLVLLPALLFGAAMHLNFHQFRLQFKTIANLAVTGLLISIGVIAFILPMVNGFPFPAALLFGAIISATDPIAVLALFNSLGAPKRLALIADGESMFNDATAVIAFRIVSAVVVAGSVFNQAALGQTVLQFLYVFFGSIALGAAIGYLTSEVLARIKNDYQVETTITLAAAFIAFVGAEHWFHLSGVIASVIAGLVVGNLGQSRFSPQVEHYVHLFWDYLGYLAVSLVFFFATFNLDLTIFLRHPKFWLSAIPVVLLARAVSVYTAFYLSNRLKFFSDEPNVGRRWQHILNWAGLRGVIPLVLVLSLPEDYVYRSEIFELTFAALLFTLFVNGLTIKKLMIGLGVHLPDKVEALKKLEERILALWHHREQLRVKLSLAVDRPVLHRLTKKLDRQIAGLKQKLAGQLEGKELKQSLELQALEIERHTYEKLLKERQLPESAYFDMDSQLDFQVDAIDYPEIHSRAIAKGGMVASKTMFRQRILKLRRLRLASKILDLTIERYALVRARLLASQRVMRFLDECAGVLKDRGGAVAKAIGAVKRKYLGYRRLNQAELNRIARTDSAAVKQYHQLIQVSLPGGE